MLGGFTLAPAKQAAALDPIARWVRANGRLSIQNCGACPQLAPLPHQPGNEWVEVPPPELFDPGASKGTCQEPLPATQIDLCSYFPSEDLHIRWF